MGRPKKVRFSCSCGKQFDKETSLNRHVGMTGHKLTTGLSTTTSASASGYVSNENLYSSMREILARNGTDPIMASELAKTMIEEGKSPTQSSGYLQTAMAKAVKEVRGDIDYNGRGRYCIGEGKVKGRRAAKSIVGAKKPKAATHISPSLATAIDNPAPAPVMDAKEIQIAFLTTEVDRLRKVVIQLSHTVVSSVGID